MPKSIREIAASLTTAGAATKKVASERARKKRPTPREIEEMLLRFLKGDEEGSASRLTAAKILLERLGASGSEGDEAEKRGRQERAEAEAEAQAVLAELAAARLAGVSGTGALDPDGAAGTTDAAVTPRRPHG